MQAEIGSKDQTDKILSFPMGAALSWGSALSKDGQNWSDFTKKPLAKKNLTNKSSTEA